MGSPREVMLKVVDCSLGASEFKIKSCPYVYFQTNTFEKDTTTYLILFTQPLRSGRI